MMLTIRPEEWLGYMRSEYLASFIREGGASIKFGVPLCDAERGALGDGLRKEARDHGYLFAEVNAAQTRVHLTDQIFYRLADANRLEVARLQRAGRPVPAEQLHTAGFLGPGLLSGSGRAQPNRRRRGADAACARAFPTTCSIERTWPRIFASRCTPFAMRN